jgi:hypothetical protein
MAPRQQLSELLHTIADNVYFQAPPSTGMQYPCLLYKLDSVDTDYAGNRPYSHNKRYLITIIDRNPDSDLMDKIAELPTARFSTRFVTEGLTHTAFNLYF